MTVAEAWRESLAIAAREYLEAVDYDALVLHRARVLCAIAAEAAPWLIPVNAAGDEGEVSS